ncbi:MAG: DegT/DnrJ/EryC1/StrS family aminotransferase [Gammaproteobacteria bacterium]|nr:DegT/DnrJ/EryC1/StrS family aminotransferase [Gammaproteobacteria bacterium]
MNKKIPVVFLGCIFFNILSHDLDFDFYSSFNTNYPKYKNFSDAESQIRAFPRNIGVGTLNISDNAKKYVNQVLDSNRLSYGPFLSQFESSFAQLHENKFGLISNSGTSSLQIALQALKEIHGWNDGDEVIVPAVTFVATSNIVLHNNMQPVFVDIEKNYYEIDPSLIEEKITARTRAIIPVHLFGQPCDMDPIKKIAQKHNLKIIEDSCETMYARYKGQMVGNLGDISCFSTYIAHLLTTGVGGLSLTNNPEYAVKMRSLLNHGRDSIYISISDDDNVSNEKLKEIVARRFSFISIGHSFRITEMEGALGVAQLEELAEIVEFRRNNAQHLIKDLKTLDAFIQLPKIRPETEHSFMMFPIVILNEPKTNLVNFLEANGVETRDMLPLINQPVYKRLFNINQKDYPVADWINTNGFYIGCHQDLTYDDLDYVINLIKCYFKKEG